MFDNLYFDTDDDCDEDEKSARGHGFQWAQSWNGTGNSWRTSMTTQSDGHASHPPRLGGISTIELYIFLQIAQECRFDLRSSLRAGSKVRSLTIPID